MTAVGTLSSHLAKNPGSNRAQSIDGAGLRVFLPWRKQNVGLSPVLPDVNAVGMGVATAAGVFAKGVLAQLRK